MIFRLALLFVFASLQSVISGQTNRLVPQQYPTIQTAIAVAVNGDTVLVAPGTYNENLNYFGKDLVVMSAMGAAVTTIRGNFTGRVVTMGSTVPATAVLDGFTIENGEGGVLMDSNSATVKNCIIKNNATTGNWGGGGILIICQPGYTTTPRVMDTVFSGNFADESGGGIFIDLYPGASSPASCFVSIDRCTFINNVAGGTFTGNYNSSLPYQSNGGGGLSARQLEPTGMLSVTVTDSAFNYNQATSAGGAAAFETLTSATMRNCKILGNTGGASGYAFAGALFNNTSNLDVRNCVIAGNSSPNSIGAIGSRENYMQTSTTSVINCTIADNFAPSVGGVLLGGTATVSNTIFWGNFGIDVAGTNVTTSYCNLQWALASSVPSNVSVDPLFVDAAALDYHLSRQSPLVDIGDPFATTGGVKDIDGDARLSGSRIDMGADEVPVAALNGSGEDLELHTYTATSGDPNKAVLQLAPGDILFVRLKSAGGNFIGTNPLIVGQPYTTGSPPVSPPGLPGIHLDGFMLQVVYGSAANGFLVGPGLAPDGVLLAYGVPPGLTGFSFRLQGFAVSPLAANGAYAVTEAHDLDF